MLQKKKKIVSCCFNLVTHHSLNQQTVDIKCMFFVLYYHFYKNKTKLDVLHFVDLSELSQFYTQLIAV